MAHEDVDRQAEIGLDVRPKVQASTWQQDPRDLTQELLVHDPPLVMTGFPPGIWKIDVHG